MFVGSVQIISCLDSQSEFQMFTLFSGRHIGGLRRSSIVGSIILRGTTLGQRTHLKLGELSSLFIVYNIAIS